MCEINAYVLKGEGEEELLLEGVDLARAEDGKVLLKNLFGEERVFEGRIVEMSIRRNRLVLKR